MVKNIYFENKLKQFKNDSALGAIRDLIGSFKKLEILEFLRANGRGDIFLEPDSTSVIERTALAFTKAEGYQQCLDDIEYFIETFLKIQNVKTPKTAAAFGALNRAIKNGDLTEEDLKDRYR